MNVNFFEWLRSGVKQSVLLGVSDAIETMGTPTESDELHPKMLAFLQDEDSGSKRVGSRGGRTKKRLGRSLNELDSAKQ